MLKNVLLQWIRKMGLMHGFDRFYFKWNQVKYFNRNRKFRKAHPGIDMPEPYMLYESFRLDYAAYYHDGRDTAQWVADVVKPFLNSANPKILEWGCGPARVIRHLPEIFPNGEIHGTDYNTSSIEWCKKHIRNVQFNRNSLEPDLPYKDEYFDMVYALSVFTHLSERHHHSWLNEVGRITRTGGIFLLTTQGNAFIKKLTAEERKKFQTGELVVRAKVEEGHRAYSAFQPTTFMQSLFNGQWNVVKMIPGGNHAWGPGQDTWILQKIKHSG